VAAAGGRVGNAAAQSSVDRFQDALQVSIYITVPKTQNPKSIRKKFRVTPHIALPVFLKIVLATIDLNDEPMLHADEIDDDLLARRLPSEMIPAFSPRT
jgi:hypothetical protein